MTWIHSPSVQLNSLKRMRQRLVNVTHRCSSGGIGLNTPFGCAPPAAVPRHPPLLALRQGGAGMQHLQPTPPQGTPGLAWGRGPSLVSIRPPGVSGGSGAVEPSGSILECEAPWVMVPVHTVGTGRRRSLCVPQRFLALLVAAVVLVTHPELGSVPSPVTPQPAVPLIKTSNSFGKPGEGSGARTSPPALRPALGMLLWGRLRAGEPRLLPARCLLVPLPARQRSRDRAIMKTSVGAEAGERGDALQMRSWGSRGGSFMYDHVYVSDRLWNGALLRGCAAPGPFICDWLVWSCVMVPSAPCCFSFFTYKHRSQRLGEDELGFVIFTYTLAQKSGQGGELQRLPEERGATIFLILCLGRFFLPRGIQSRQRSGWFTNRERPRTREWSDLHKSADSDSYCSEEFFCNRANT